MNDKNGFNCLLLLLLPTAYCPLPPPKHGRLNRNDADLIAQGPRPQDRWRRPLQTSAAESVLGRTAEQWAVPWDDRISRKHATLRWNGRSLEVRRCADSRNSIFYRGQQRDEFQVQIGEHFVMAKRRLRSSISQCSSRIWPRLLTPSRLTRRTCCGKAVIAMRIAALKCSDACPKSLLAVAAMKSSARASSTSCCLAFRSCLRGDRQKAGRPSPRTTKDASPGNGAASSANKSSDVDTEADKPVSSESMEVLHWDCRSLTGQKVQTIWSASRPSGRDERERVAHLESLARQRSLTQSEMSIGLFVHPSSRMLVPAGPFMFRVISLARHLRSAWA